MWVGCKNKTTGKHFINITYKESDSVINPVGKVVPYDEKLFTEIEEFDSSLFTPEQLEKAESILAEERAREENILSLKNAQKNINDSNILHVLYNQMYCRILVNNKNFEQPNYLNKVIEKLHEAFEKEHVTCRSGAEVRSHRFDVSLEVLKEYLRKHCPYVTVRALFSNDVLNLADFKKAS